MIAEFKDIVEAKADEIQTELERFSANHDLANQGIQLVFSLSIKPFSVVERELNTDWRTPFSEIFTRENILKAGISPYMATKITTFFGKGTCVYTHTVSWFRIIRQ